MSTKEEDTFLAAIGGFTILVSAAFVCLSSVLVWVDYADLQSLTHRVQLLEDRK